MNQQELNYKINPRNRISKNFMEICDDTGTLIYKFIKTLKFNSRINQTFMQIITGEYEKFITDEE